MTEGRKKILFVIGCLQPGGAERTLLETVRALHEEFSITVIARDGFPCDDRTYEGQIRKYARFVSCCEHYPKKFLLKHVFFGVGQRIRRIKWRKMTPSELYDDVVGSLEFDVKVAFLEGWSTRVLSGSPKDGSKLYAWVHTDVLSNPWSVEEFDSDLEEAEAYKRFDGVFAVSTQVADAVYEKFNVRAMFVKNIVNSECIVGRSAEAIDWRKDNRLMLLTVGTLKPVKGYERLLYALRSMKEEGYEFVLCMLGAGPDEVRLRQLADTLGLSEHVSFFGHVDNPYPYIRMADLLICSSFAEGYSGVVVESLILGTPVLVTECAGMHDILGQGSEYGIIVDNSEEGLRKGLRRVFQNREILAFYSGRAEKRGREFDAEALKQGFVAALRLNE